MTIPANRSRPAELARAAATRLEQGLGLTRAGLGWLLGAAAAVGVMALVFLSVSEDVVSGDGVALRDPSNLRLVTDHRAGWLVSVARAVTDLGSVRILVPLAVLVGVVLWYRGMTLLVAVAPAMALAVGGALAAAGKHFVGRARPPADVRLLAETDASFPSGHATDSAALYLAIGLVLAVVVFRRPLARLAVFVVGAALAAVVGASRLVLGVHWPTDVVAGWAIGSATAIVVVVSAVLLCRLQPPVSADRDRLPGRLLALVRVSRRSLHAATAV